MALTNSNLFSESYGIIKKFIDTNISDPKNRYKKQWVHPTMPNITDNRFDGYPFIVVEVDMNEESKSLDRSTSNKVFRALLSVYSDDAAQVDSIASEVLQKFKDETLTNSLKEFKSMEIASSPFGFEILGGKKISRRLIGLIGVKRI
jgi:hypothetical protein